MKQNKRLKVVCTDPPYLLPEFIKNLKNLTKIDLTIYPDFANDEMALVERAIDADVIIVDILTQYSKKIISRWPKLKVIITTSVGTNHIDVEYCSLKKIKVINFPGYNSRAVAEMAFANMMSLLRKIPAAQMHVRGGGWRSDYFEGFELGNKKLGVIGAGNIGRQIIKIGLGFEMEILCTTKNPTQQRAVELGIKKFYTFDEVIKKSDFIVLAVPFTPETKNLINKNVIMSMKNTAYLINVSRGNVVDTLALAETIYDKKIAGAALDVIENEPFDIRIADLKIQEMLNSSNDIITPHLGGATREANIRMGESLIKEIEGIV